MHNQSVPVGDRDEAPANPKREATTYPCDAVIRSQLVTLRERPGWSNNVIASRTGVSTALVSQYLSDSGCIYSGDVAGFERKAVDMLKNEARRRASGVETLNCLAAQEMAKAFEYIRKTNDLGAIVCESGDGKSRGAEPYLKENPTAILIGVSSWHRGEEAVRGAIFKACPQGAYDGRTNRMDYAVSVMRNSDRLFIVDDAHKLTLAGLQCLVDFHDATHCPVGLLGTMALFEKLERDPQLFSRVGLKWEIGQSRPKELLDHLIRCHIPAIDGERDELLALCEQVVRQAGHFRAVHKQLKLAVEMRESSDKADKIKSWCQAFRLAHGQMLRGYKLN